MKHLALPLALALAPLSAQQVVHVVADAAVRIDLTLGELPRRPPGLGALLAVPELQPTLWAVLQRSLATLDPALLVASQPANLIAVLLRELDPEHLRRVTVTALAPPDAPSATVWQFDDPAVAARLFDAIVGDCHARQLPVTEDAPLPDARRCTAADGDTRLWVLHHGDRIVTGRDDVALQLGPPDATVPGYSQAIALGPAALEDLGSLADLAAALGFVDTIRLAHDACTDGTGCHERLLLRGRRPAGAPAARDVTQAPRLPALAGQFAIVRGHVDPAAVLALLRAALDGRATPDHFDAIASLCAGWNGAFAFGLAAPARGGFYPRITVALGRLPDGDGAAARELLAQLGGQVEERELDGIATTLWSPPEVPPALRPSASVVDGVLWLAESPATLRSLHKARADAADVFADAAAVACDAPPGATVLAEAWFDCEAIWRLVGANWATGPLRLALYPNVDDPVHAAEPIRDRDALPEADAVAATLGRGRAVCFADGDGIGLALRAPAIGPLLSAFGSFAVPMLPDVIPMALLAQHERNAAHATQARAERLGRALVAWRRDHGDAMPAAVAELQPLLPPGDAEPLVAPHAPGGGELEYLRRFSFQPAPADMTAVPDRSSPPGSPRLSVFPRLRRTPRPVFAFCGFGYAGHHLLILADGDVVWVRSEQVLDAIAPETGR